MKKEVEQKKGEMQKRLKESEDAYIRKEGLKKKLKEVKSETEKVTKDQLDELRKLRQIIEADKKSGIFEEKDKQ